MQSASMKGWGNFSGIMGTKTATTPEGGPGEGSSLLGGGVAPPPQKGQNKK